jgi:uncharacterized protein (UPF0333 family)
MSMQTDVKAGTLTSSGFYLKYRTRVKGISVKGTTSAGALELFDTVTAPVSATYARSATTITVTKNGHGLKAGDKIGISFAVDGNGVSATSGNYTVATVPDGNTFTLTDINSGTITAPINCLYATRWLITLRFADGDVYTNYWLIPGEGMLAENGVYATLTSLNAVSIFYG